MEIFREGTSEAVATVPTLFHRLEVVVTATFELWGFGEDKWRESQGSLREWGIRAAHAREGSQAGCNSHWRWKSSGNICHPAAGQMARQAGRRSPVTRNCQTLIR